MGTVTIPREEYDALISLRCKMNMLEDMIVTGEIQSWEQALLIVSDVSAYDRYITEKLEAQYK